MGDVVGMGADVHARNLVPVLLGDHDGQPPVVL